MPLEADDVKQGVDLVELIGRDTVLKQRAKTGGGEFSGACVFCGGDDRLRVQVCAPPGKKPAGARWMCRQCQPQWGDAIGYIMRRQGISFQDALAFLAGDHLADQHRAAIDATPSPAKEEPKFDRKAWEAAAEALVDECAGILFQDEGKRALEFLHKRGLCDSALQAWGIGFNPRGRPGAKRGITIPCRDSAGLHAVNVRTGGDPPYELIRGSHRWIFGLWTYVGATTAFLYESELDAVLSHQTGLTGVGHGALPAGQGIKTEYAPFFETIIDVIVMPDNDKPGREHAEKLCKIPGFHIAEFLPHGKDLTEYQEGGDVLEFLLTQIGRLDGDHGP